MAVQLSDAVRNAVLDQWESAIGTAPLLRIYTGAQPANCAAASTGTLLAECALPSDWMAAASGGSKSKLGTWQDGSANAAGTAGYYRIFDTSGTTCHEQGSVTATGGGGDMTVDNVVFAVGQVFTVTGFTRTMPHA